MLEQSTEQERTHQLRNPITSPLGEYWRYVDIPTMKSQDVNYQVDIHVTTRRNSSIAIRVLNGRNNIGFEKISLFDNNCSKFQQCWNSGVWNQYTRTLRSDATDDLTLQCVVRPENIIRRLYIVWLCVNSTLVDAHSLATERAVLYAPGARWPLRITRQRRPVDASHRTVSSPPHELPLSLKSLGRWILQFSANWNRLQNCTLTLSMQFIRYFINQHLRNFIVFDRITEFYANEVQYISEYLTCTKVSGWPT